MRPRTSPPRWGNLSGVPSGISTPITWIRMSCTAPTRGWGWGRRTGKSGQPSKGSTSRAGPGLIGVSNVSAEQLDELCRRAEVKPMVVQNRCFAVLGWDYRVREICRAHGIVYQGFSLLTANRQFLFHPRIREIAGRLGDRPGSSGLPVRPGSGDAAPHGDQRPGPHGRGPGGPIAAALPGRDGVHRDHRPEPAVTRLRPLRESPSGPSGSCGRAGRPLLRRPRSAPPPDRSGRTGPPSRRCWPGDRGRWTGAPFRHRP